MNSKTLAAIAAFSALTVVLNQSPLKFPAPYLPFLYYQIWEIPIVVAFLLFGPVTGASVSLVNTVVLFALFPGDLPAGPFYNLMAVLSMLVGIFIAHWLTNNMKKDEKRVMPIIMVTLFGIVLRVIVMSFANWAFMRYPYPIGYSAPDEFIIAILPFIAFFNASVAVYTIPAGYVLARAISRGIKTNLWSPNKIV
jgi:riboflavin transporter FmnP